MESKTYYRSVYRGTGFLLYGLLILNLTPLGLSLLSEVFGLFGTHVADLWISILWGLGLAGLMGVSIALLLVGSGGLFRCARSVSNGVGGLGRLFDEMARVVWWLNLLCVALCLFSLFLPVLEMTSLISYFLLPLLFLLLIYVFRAIALIAAREGWLRERKLSLFLVWSHVSVALFVAVLLTTVGLPPSGDSPDPPILDVCPWAVIALFLFVSFIVELVLLRGCRRRIRFDDKGLDLTTLSRELE